MSDEKQPSSTGRLLRAFAPGRHGRRAADLPGWGIRVVKEVGFPIFVGWYLLTRLGPHLDNLFMQLPENLDRVLASDRTVRTEQHAAEVEALHAMTVQIATLNEQAQDLKNEASTVRGMVLGRLKCPPTPVIKPCQPNTTIILPPAAPAAPAPSSAPQKPRRDP